MSTGTAPGLQAVLFDFDGLLLDTESTRLQAWTAGLAGVGVVLDGAAYLRLTHDPPGCTHSELAQALVNDRGSIFIAELVEAISAESMRRATALSAAMPGSRELLRATRDAGMRTALVTGSPRAWIEHHIVRLDLVGAFDVVVARGDAVADKPHPAPYQLALHRLGIAANEAVALEDSPIGVMSAHGAGIACVAIPNPVTAALDFDQARAILPTLDHVTVATLADLLHLHNSVKG